MSDLGGFVWRIADQLRGVYKPHQYGGVILPFTILRRLDCVLAPTRSEVRALAAKYSNGALDVQVKRRTGLGFYNTNPDVLNWCPTSPSGSTKSSPIRTRLRHHEIERLDWVANMRAPEGVAGE